MAGRTMLYHKSRETKGTFVYESDVEDEPIRTVYVRKDYAKTLPDPERLSITVDEG